MPHSPDSYVEAETPNVMVTIDRVFVRQLGLEEIMSRALMIGLALLKE